MKISILCSSPEHPVIPEIKKWIGDKPIRLCHKSKDLVEGDFLFLISCSEIIRKEIRDKFNHCLVVHASDLPNGRGWSPYIWHIINGKNDITVSLIEADDPVDSGKIWYQEIMHFEGHELYDEINQKLFDATFKLMTLAINNPDTIPREQKGTPSYFPKRSPKDSELDVTKTIQEQFNLMRVADEIRYPCFFNIRGHQYKIILRKIQ